jgi:DNA segregation ATPase FtsK/SpoIIIE, S-DNA-T family
MALPPIESGELQGPLPDGHPWGNDDPCRQLALLGDAAVHRIIARNMGDTPENGPWDSWRRNESPALLPTGGVVVGNRMYPNGDRVPEVVGILDQGHAAFPTGEVGEVMLLSSLQRLQGATDPRDLVLFGYDNSLGKRFAAFTNRGSELFQQETSIDRLLSKLEAEMLRRQTEELKGWGSVREMIEEHPKRDELDHRPVPFWVAAIVGDKELKPEELARLLRIAQLGPDVGIHLLTAGVDLPEDAPNFDFVSTEVFVDPGEAPPSALVMKTAADIARLFKRPVESPDYENLRPERLGQQSSTKGIDIIMGKEPNGNEDIVVSFDDATPMWRIGGRSGTGKTTVLFNAVLQACERYSPDEFRYTYIDLKEGVDAAILAGSNPVPHGELVAFNTVDHEIVISSLRDLREEMERRGELFAAAGVRKYEEYRNATDGTGVEPCPRKLLVVDEIQRLLTGPCGGEAIDLLEELARQGRFVGIHMAIGSQTMPARGQLPKSIDKMDEQFGMRLALSQSEDVLDSRNHGARSLPRYHVIVNTQGGADGFNRVARFPDIDLQTIEGAKNRMAAAYPGAADVKIYNGKVKPALAADKTYNELEPNTMIPPAAVIGKQVTREGKSALVEFEGPRSNLTVFGADMSAVGDVVDTVASSLARQHDKRDFPATFRIVCASANRDVALRANGLVKRLAAHHNVVGYGRAQAGKAVDDARAAMDTSDPGRGREYLIVIGADGVTNEELHGPQLRDLMLEGPSRGVHTIVTASNPDELDVRLKEGRSVELSRLTKAWVTTADVPYKHTRPLYREELHGVKGRAFLYDESQALDHPAPQKVILFDTNSPSSTSHRR